jgi:hypothetical protein
MAGPDASHPHARAPVGTSPSTADPERSFLFDGIRRQSAHLQTGGDHVRRSLCPRLLRVFLPAIILLAGISARADAPWVPFGPGGGPVISLAVDPGHDATVYAVTGTGL